MYYTMTNGQIMVAVTVKGAELLSMVNHEAGNKEYIWVGNEKYWDGHGPSLFPIVGRVKNGKYMYKGKEYSIMSPHGFVDVYKRQVQKVYLKVYLQEATAVWVKLFYLLGKKVVSLTVGIIILNLIHGWSQ